MFRAWGTADHTQAHTDTRVHVTVGISLSLAYRLSSFLLLFLSLSLSLPPPPPLSLSLSLSLIHSLTHNIHVGGNGYINDYPTGRFLRDAKLYEIGAGTSEIRRLVIGRAFNDLFKE